MQYTRTDYTVSLGQGMVIENVSRARMARLLHVASEGGFQITYHYETTLVDGWAEDCYGCRARPALIEADCDGPYQTVTCDSPQCDWSAAVEARERDRKAGCPQRLTYPNHDEDHNC
jgi:hypothetical protein